MPIFVLRVRASSDRAWATLGTFGSARFAVGVLEHYHDVQPTWEWQVVLIDGDTEVVVWPES